MTGETVLTAKLQQDKFHADKVRSTQGQSIAILAFKTYSPPILGGLGEWRESNTPLTDIRSPDLWNVHDGVRGL